VPLTPLIMIATVGVAFAAVGLSIFCAEMKLRSGGCRLRPLFRCVCRRLQEAAIGFLHPTRIVRRLGT
jgi:hypothetical protein